MKLFFKVAAVAIVFLMVSVTCQTAVACMYDDDDIFGRGSRADDPIPYPFRDFDKMVLELIRSTSPANRTDSDNDTIPDTVERIIGTDPYNPDSDMDMVMDMDEVFNRTNPLKADSNEDGLIDHYEVRDDRYDLDRDGIPNVWDSDNDGDGVPDSDDLSSFSRTQFSDEFHLDLNGTGRATSILFQVRTQDVDHMSLSETVYDWPDDDTHGLMQDRDGSEADVFLAPVLELRGLDIPITDEVRAYAVTGNTTTTYIPLIPKKSFGSIVALQGKLFMPAVDEPRNLSFDIRMGWRVDGASDKVVKALRADDGNHVSARDTGPVRANASTIGDTETLQWFDLGNDKVALLASNGRYLSAGEDGKVTASAEFLTALETFTLVEVDDDHVALMAHNDNYVKVTSDGSLEAVATAVSDLSTFELVDRGVISPSTMLAYYGGETFALTGCIVEEHQGVDVGVSYHVSNVAEALSANVMLTYEFMRNSSNEVSDIPSLLDTNGYHLSTDTRSFDTMDEALVALMTEMTKDAKDSLLGDDMLPIIACLKQTSSFAEMYSMGDADNFWIGTSLAVDMTSVPVLEIKSMQTNWYTSAGEQAIPITEIANEIWEWEMPAEDRAALIGMVLQWNVGEQMITKEGDTYAEFHFSEHETWVHIATAVLKGIVTGVKLINSAIMGTVAFAVKIQFLLSAFETGKAIESTLRVTTETVNTVGQTTSGTSGYWSYLNKIAKVLVWVAFIIEVALAVYSFFVIASAYDWSDQGIYIAGVYAGLKISVAVIVLAFSLLALSAITLAPLFAVLVLIIGVGDLISRIWIEGGIIEKGIEKIIDALTDVRPFVEFDMDFLDTDVEITDYEGNGLTVGDRITYRADTVKWKYMDEDDYDSENVQQSHLLHMLDLEKPEGSGSTAGFRNHLGESDTDGKTYESQEETVYAWIEPGMAMHDFPVTIQHKMQYRVYYEECRWVPFKGWVCDVNSVEDWVYADPMTMYFDVLPATLEGFIGWSELTPLDLDSDGINDTDEVATDPMKWDTDGDGLSDGAEAEDGTDPTMSDTDGDGSNDLRELVTGSDGTLWDTDGDGLDDGTELAGWVVTFTYEGKEFDWHQISDPRLVDTDGDGLSDFDEFLTLHNPMSADTDGDGVEDHVRDHLTHSLEADGTFARFPGGDGVNFLAADDEGRVYAAETYPAGQAIYRYLPSGTRDSDWSPFTFNEYIMSMSCDAYGYLYITLDDDQGTSTIAKYGPDGEYIKWFTGSGPNWPVEIWGIVVDDEGHMYVTDFNENGPHRVIVLDSDGKYQYQFGSKGTGNGQFDSPRGLDIDSRGFIYVADHNNSRIQMFKGDGTFVHSIGSMGSGPGQMVNPRDVAVDANDDLFVIDKGNDRLHKFASNGTFLASIGGIGSGPGQFNYPTNVVVHGDDRVLVSEWFNYRVSRILNNFTVVEVDAKEFNDTDADALNDTVEEAGWEIEVVDATGFSFINVSSDPLMNDTDGDGLNDTEEHDIGSNPRDVDTDGDGIPDGKEHFEIGTNVTNWDTDGDGLDDGRELTFGSDPTLTDTDAEGLSDLVEFQMGTHPNMTDTDLDGLDDAVEGGSGSDPLDPDADEDTMFDSHEAILGTNPNDPDHDGDGLIDGYELIYLTDPTDGDSDGDGIPDGMEVAMGIDPLSNDTDGDGLTDMVEVDTGSNPASSDSDGDGVPDNLDTDHLVSLEEPVYVVADLANDTVGLVDDLADVVDVRLISARELLEDHRDARYIVLVGPLSTEVGSPGAVIGDLLEATPHLMEEGNEGHIAVLYGAWAPTQTIVMVTRTYPSDHYRVLGMLRSVSVRVSESALSYTYTSPRSCSVLDDHNTLMRTDTTVLVKLDGMATFTIDVARYSGDDVPYPLTLDSGLLVEEVSLGKLIEIELGDDLEEGIGVSGAIINIYYTLDDLDMNGDGDHSGPGDIDEGTLGIYLFDEEEGRWTRISGGMDGVTATGVNTTDQEVYGISYAGYMWADLTHLSLFSGGGRALSGVATLAGPGDDMTVTVGEVATFDGTGSEGNGDIVRYRWTFEYKGRTVTMKGATPTFRFGRPGNYTVTLMVTDSYGGVGMDDVVVTVVPKVLPTFTIRVGPLVDDTGVPVRDARVKISWGNEMFSGTTDFSGFADVEVGRDAIGDDVTVHIERMGFEPQEYTTTITPDERLELQPSTMIAIEATGPPAKEAEEPEGWEYAIVTIALILALLALMITVRRRPGRGEDEQP